MLEQKKIPFSKLVTDYTSILLGCLIIALTFNLFLNPNGIVTGGVSGISTIVEHISGIEAAYIQWTLNVPIFITGIIILGRNYGLKTFMGSLLLPLFIYLTRDLTPLTDQLLLASVFGGVGLGFGLGLAFRGRGSTGGTDVIVQIINKYTGIGLGTIVLFLDGVIIFAAGVFLGIEKAMFALISLYIISKTIDAVQLGLKVSKVAYIISHEQEKIGQIILKKLDRGVTILNATGGYTGEPKRILMVVFSQRDTTRLKEAIRSIDPNAFIIVTNTYEVLGKGFKKY
ncbi:MAG: YitT family protein [Vulcanibacillus sp.]